MNARDAKTLRRLARDYGTKALLREVADHHDEYALELRDVDTTGRRWNTRHAKVLREDVIEILNTIDGRIESQPQFDTTGA